MQVTRTALQKRISRDLNDWAVTWIRYGFAMPWIVALWLAMIYVDVWPQMNQKFLLFSLLAGIAQIVGDDFVGGIIFTAQFCRQHRFCKNRSPANCATWRVVFWRSNITVGVFGRVGGSGGAFIDDADRAGENNFTQYVASVTNEHGNHGAVIGDTVCADIFVYSAGVSSIGRTVPVY